METRKIGKLTEISATNGYLHKIGSENYEECKKRILLPSESPSDYEEITELPKYTRDEYEKKVSELIRERYSVDAELAILRQRDMKQTEYEEYNTFAEECKVRAKEILENNEDEPIPTELEE